MKYLVSFNEEELIAVVYKFYFDATHWSETEADIVPFSDEFIEKANDTQGKIETKAMCKIYKALMKSDSGKKAITKTLEKFHKELIKEFRECELDKD